MNGVHRRYWEQKRSWDDRKSKTEQAFEAAERAVELFEEREVSGKTAIDAREDLNEARRDRVRTILDYNRALAELRRAAGSNNN